MAILSRAKEQGSVSEADSCQYVSPFICYGDVGHLAACSIRFAPPLVISEEDLMKAVDIIKQCLEDLDKVNSEKFTISEELTDDHT